MTEWEKMLAGEMYHPGDETLAQMRLKARSLTFQYNQTSWEDDDERRRILSQLLGHIAGDIKIHPNFNCDYGKNISIGDNFYMNVGCVILDCATVTIGDQCMVGPQVGIYTACHPIDPVARNSGKEFAKPIVIGNSCWIGGHATINPGVTLGDNVVVASGAVVTKNFPNNVVIGGNPARVIKEII